MSRPIPSPATTRASKELLSIIVGSLKLVHTKQWTENFSSGALLLYQTEGIFVKHASLGLLRFDTTFSLNGPAPRPPEGA